MSDGNLSYSEKFALLNQKMRWEVADELRRANLEAANALHQAVQPSHGFYVRHGKRVLDVMVSALALVLSMPINVVLVVVTILDLGWPALFSQKRLGKGGHEFVITKLRTMREVNDNQGRPLLGAHRVTRVGRVIRRTSLDELLNFWSILKGDMSLIGPRPLVPEYLSRFSDRHKQRFAVKPGLECPLPVSLDRAPTYEDQFENDCWYVCNVSFFTDLRLMVRVVVSVFDRHQNKARGSSSRGSFMGYDERGRVITTKNIPMWAIDTVLHRHGLLEEAPPCLPSSGPAESDNVGR